MKQLLDIKKLSFYITVSPKFENILKNEIKRIFKSNSLLIPKFGKKEAGSVSFEVGIDTDYYNTTTPTTTTTTQKQTNSTLQQVTSRGEGHNRDSENTIKNDAHHTSLGVISKYLWSLSSCTRLAESIRIRISDRINCRNFNELEQSLSAVPWLEFFPSSTEVPLISVSCTKSKLYHSNAVKERIQKYFQHHVLPEIRQYQVSVASKHRKKLKKQLRKLSVTSSVDPDVALENSQTGPEIEVQPPQTKLYVRLDEDQLQLTIDATSVDNVMLHKRIQNKHVTEAPIRETLAYAALSLAQVVSPHNQNSFWDAFMGSGGILQEAVSCVSTSSEGKVLPNSQNTGTRVFQYQYFPWHLSEQFNEYQQNLKPKIPTKRVNNRFFIGSDISDRALDSTRFNLTQEGYQPKTMPSDDSNDIESVITDDDYLLLQSGDFQKVYKNIELISKRYQTPFTILSNLPYGHRILHQDPKHQTMKISDKLVDLFKRFGTMLKNSDESVLKHVYVINGNPKFKELTGVKWIEIESFKNGGIDVQLLQFQRESKDTTSN
ncbi:putative RNA methylase domain-containing protein [Tieghemostelium lacteum]|uniref:Putative RNA methylase domain-containing protein n=1 Tax=Tieghemostelium lacteum TaxID=361077 RepID=A0A152A4D4_TIELA|nr:putative RNA methylase domain-containing protein [Tieghemostelium lacteum]|eukprot:KYR01074.1 putative RNA methylase domain-containing protein [Tieghemostelium lacteum]